MRFLRSNTAVIVTVGPFYDKTDGVTIETALTITNERITLTADTDAGSAPTNILDNITGATAATNNDLNYITGNDAGLMQLELEAANVNRVGRMFLTITDAANHVPVFHEFFVLPQAIYDWLIGVIVPLPVNVTTLLGTAWLTPAVAGTPDVNTKTITDGAITAAKLASDAITAAKLAADVTTELQAGLATPTNITAGTITTVTNLTNAPTNGDFTATMKTSITTAVPTAAVIADAVLDEDMTGHQTQGSLGQAIGDPAADTNTIYKAVVTDAAGVNIAADIVAVKAQTAAIEVDTGVIGALGAGLTALATQTSVDAVKVDTAAILVDTTEIGVAGAGLTAINLPNQTMDIVGNITGNISGSVGSVTGAVGSVTGAVGSVTGSVGSVVGLTASDVGAIKTKTDNLPTDPADQSLIIDATDAIVALIGVAGAGLTNINLPDQTMNIIGNITGNLSGSVGSVTGAVGSVTGAVGSVTGAVGSVTGDVTVAVASKTGYALTTADKQAIADEWLNRNIAGGGSGAARNVRSAMRYQRNKVAIVAGVMTVYEEDDITPAWEADVTTTAGNPISAIDPTT